MDASSEATGTTGATRDAHANASSTAQANGTRKGGRTSRKRDAEPLTYERAGYNLRSDNAAAVRMAAGIRVDLLGDTVGDIISNMCDMMGYNGDIVPNNRVTKPASGTPRIWSLEQREALEQRARTEAGEEASRQDVLAAFARLVQQALHQAGFGAMDRKL